MPQSSAPDVQLPAIPAPPESPIPGGPLAEVGQASPAPTGPIPAERAAFLRARRDALSNQLESVQERRDEVADQLRSDETQASERPGLQDRLRVLDERLVQIEKDIASNSAQLANAPARSESSTGASGRGSGGRSFDFSGNLVIIFGFALLMPFAINLARRLFAPNRGPSRREAVDAAAMHERMNRMESAVDSVALEVERIGEGQRFLTQAMTESFSRANGGVGAGAGAGAAAPDAVPVRAREDTDRR